MNTELRTAPVTQLSNSIVKVDLGERSYDIFIGGHLLTDVNNFADLAQGHTSAVIVSNTKVAPLYMAQLSNTLRTVFSQVHEIVLPDGEEYKNWPTLQLIFDAMLEQQADRKTLVFALGGGVIGDMTGFAAACYMRGVDFVQVPTTLLAQVDSSVGGKTGINHELGKNMIGAFYQPKRVLCDVATLATLTEREFRSGLGEAIKYGPIFDQALFVWMEQNMAAILAQDAAALIHLIKRCCEIKAKVVNADEHEAGLRAILNFGHTFGHAIEAGLGYGAWLHGEAVTAGMVMAADLSQRLDMLSPQWCQRLSQLIERAKLPTVAPNLGVDRYLQLMQLDKKTQAGQLKFVLIKEMGLAVIQSVDHQVLRAVISANSEQ